VPKWLRSKGAKGEVGREGLVGGKGFFLFLFLFFLRRGGVGHVRVTARGEGREWSERASE